MQKIWTWLKRLSSESPLKLAILTFAIFFIIVTALSFRHYGSEFYENILIEAHGMLFDLFVIGVFVYWLNSIGEQKRQLDQRTERYQDEIEDYLGWDEPEATFRIVGNIKRLNRLGVSDIYLTHAYLRRANLVGANLVEANLVEANLSGAHLSKAELLETDLRRANLSGAELLETDLRRANLRGANLRGANLRGASLWGANLCGANLSKAELLETDLSGTDLSGTDLMGAELSGALLCGANLCGANLRKADLVGANLWGSLYNQDTRFPDDFDPSKEGMILKE